MINKKKILAIIPARGGSKRLPGKNIRLLGGIPLIKHTINAVIHSKYVDKIIVSTDDKQIASVAKESGADVPFLRPAELSTDTANTFSVVEHALLFLKKKPGQEYDYILLLQPTSPLRTSKDIDASVELLEQKNADAVISVCECEHSPIWSNTLPENLSMNKFIKEEYANIRSQDLPTFYRLNGAIYLVDIKRLLDEQDFILKEKSFAYVMDSNKSVDIDNEIDFKLAEILLQNV